MPSLGDELKVKLAPPVALALSDALWLGVMEGVEG